MEYDFFGHLNLVLETNDHRGYVRYFDNEYSRIASRGRSSSAPTVTVRIVDRLPDERTGDVSDTVRYKRLFDYSYLVRDIDSDDVVIFFKSHPIDKFYMNAIGVFLQAQVFEPVMYLKLLERNILFMHAAGVSTAEDGYLFPAYGGTGKTTLSVALLNHGYKLLGDDLLFVDIAGQRVHSYARPLHLFTYNIRNLHGAKVPLRYQVAIYTKNGIRYVLEKALKTEFLISTRVHADEIFPQDPYGDSVPYRRLCFLVKSGDAVRDVELHDGNIADVAEEIMESEDLNTSLYEILQDPGKIDSVRKLERRVIGDLLGQLGSLSYVNTRKLDLADLGSFVDDHLNSGVSSVAGTAKPAAT